MRARRGTYDYRPRYQEFGLTPETPEHWTTCVGCGERFPGEGDECPRCIAYAKEEAERQEAVGKLHATFDSPFGRLGPLAVTCHTVEARRLFGVSGEGPYEFDRTEAWAYAARLRFLYGDDAVFS